MSLHNDICQKICQVIQELEDMGIYWIPSGLVALKTYAFYGKETDAPHIQYACIKRLKHMARKILAEKIESRLQGRYPIETQGEPVYKPLIELTERELLWNFEQLHGHGTLQNACDLFAYYRQKFPEPTEDLDDDSEA